MQLYSILIHSAAAMGKINQGTSVECDRGSCFIWSGQGKICNFSHNELAMHSISELVDFRLNGSIKGRL